MKIPKRWAAVCALFSLAAGFFLAMGEKAAIAGEKNLRAGDLKGNVRISGAWALYPMVVQWGEEFMKQYPQVRIDVSAGGAGKGMADALAGFVDIGMVSREIRKEELDQGAFAIPVVKDAVFPTMNASNPALQKGLMTKGIRRETFVALWIKNEKATWGGISGSSMRDEVAVYTRSDSCGAAETWAAYLGEKQEDLGGVGVYGDPGLADAVKRDVYGIGYNNLNYAYDMKTGRPVEGIVVAPMDMNGNGKLDPGEDLSTKKKAIEAIQKGVYPSPPVRDLYLVGKGGFKGTAGEFVKWILTEGQSLVDEAGYVRLGVKSIEESRAKVGK
jgi:phosphate transport system substrate-binding protein